ncbi:MAG: ArsR/SmtB family transcription factor [Hyphomicrobiales bacterium]
MQESVAATALGALGNETRLALFQLLVRAGDDGLAVNDIQHVLGVPLSTLSHHIRTLAQAGLIVQERSGREIISRADYTVMHDLVGFLTEECCTGVELNRGSDAA